MADSATPTPFDPAAAAEGLRGRLAQLPEVLSRHLGVRLTDRALALSIGSSAQNWSGYTRSTGARMPPSTILLGIAEQYPMVSMHWLLTGKGAPIQPWASGQTESIASSVVRLAAERGVSFTRLDIQTVEQDGAEFVVFDAAGRARA